MAASPHVNARVLGANWVVLQPALAVSEQGASLTIQPDQSILASGTLTDTDIYTITVVTTLRGITGVRIEALEDPSLPLTGPGRAQTGNFVLSEFTDSNRGGCSLRSRRPDS